MGNAEALGALWCSNYGRLVVFQSGAPKAFGAYHMLLRSTHLSYGGFVGTDLQKSAGSSSKRAGFEDGLPKNTGSSSKRAVFEDGLPKTTGPSSKRAVFEDELRKNTGSSSKRGVFEDGLRKNTY
ncbi:MAG: hypothetical protein GX841_04585 [Bacteroidales bacterium]|nr:hypothetical protein [Bacteroidales bacterium]